MSKASAEQRAGRAGLTGPGHCYRLYSSAFYDQHMPTFAPPQMDTTPLEDVLLQMRALGIRDVEAFPFPSPPPVQRLQQALKLLIHIGAISKDVSLKQVAIDSKVRKEALRVQAHSGGRLTELGRLIAQFPLNPRLAKMLVVAHQSGLLSHCLKLVATLAEKSPFVGAAERSSNLGAAGVDDEGDAVDAGEEAEDNREGVVLRTHPDSDALARLRALGAYMHMGSRSSGNSGDVEAVRQRLCAEQGLLQPSMDRMVDLHAQLCRLCDQVLGKGMADEGLEGPPSAVQEAGLRQVLLAGYVDCIARKAPALTQTTAGQAPLSRRMRLTGTYPTTVTTIRTKTTNEGLMLVV